MNSEKIFEVMVFTVLILIIGILLFPFVEKIMYNTQESTAKTNVNTTIDAIKNVYLKENQKLDNVVYLPFKVEFAEDSYKTYCGNVEIDLDTKLDLKGKPVSGSITWGADDKVTVNNLKYKTHTCNKISTGDVICERNSD